MDYSFEKIITLQACDLLLTRAEKKKKILERKRRNLGESIDSFRARINRLNEESTVVQLSLEAFGTAFQILPEGRDKADMKVKIKRLEVREAMVEKKAYTYNVTSLLVKEMKYNALDAQVSATENYIASIQHKRAALSASTMRISHQATSLRPSIARQYSFQNLERVDAPVMALAGITHDVRSPDRHYRRRGLQDERDYCISMVVPFVQYLSSLV